MSASGGLGCDNTNRRKYRNVADGYARNIYIGPYTQSRAAQCDHPGTSRWLGWPP
ncbi:hypothetical protein ACIG87_23905 [Micromonospora sp. NPDC051925]|uniref:hypothetical protein n=1 Tax=Micromonospora sp. NPDC051925 TaxID=3364288 RepID=UPI0037CACDBB